MPGRRLTPPARNPEPDLRQPVELDRRARDRDVAVGVVVVATGTAVAAVRLALRPARMILRGPLVAPLVRKQTVRLGDVGSDASERGRRRLEGVPERVAEVLADVDLQETVAAHFDEARAEQVARQVLASPALEHILASPEGERVLQQIAASPAVRAALAQQTTGFLDELQQAVRAAAGQVDERLDARSRAAASDRYAGIASRAAALAVDAAVACAVYAGAVGLVAAMASLAGGLRPAWLAAALAAAGWLVISGGYFVGFWALTGQTLGMRLLGIRLGRHVGVARSIVRFVGLVLSIAPFFAGFASVPLDRKRRGLADFLAGTEVVRADGDVPNAADAAHAAAFRSPD